jgi:hypothetical protein
MVKRHVLVSRNSGSDLAEATLRERIIGKHCTLLLLIPRSQSLVRGSRSRSVSVGKSQFQCCGNWSKKKTPDRLAAECSPSFDETSVFEFRSSFTESIAVNKGCNEATIVSKRVPDRGLCAIDFHFYYKHISFITLITRKSIYE